MQRKYGVILGYISMFVQNITTLILTPIMIYVWGVGDYGVYKMVFTITSYLLLMDMGMGNAIIKFLTEFRTEKNKLKEQNFLAVTFFFYAVVSLSIVMIGLVIPNFLHFILQSFTEKELELAKLLFTVTLISVAVNLFFNSFNAILKSYEKYIFLNSTNLLKNSIRFLSIFILLKQEHGAYIIAVADIIINIVFCIIGAAYVLLKIKILPKFKGITFAFVGSIYAFSAFVFIEMIAYQMVWSVDYIILGIYTSSAIIAVYSIGTLITTFFETLAIVIYNVVMPRIMQIISNQESNEVLTAELIKVGRIKLFALCLPVIGFIFLGKNFISLWAGTQFIDAYYVAVIVLIPQFIFRVQDVISIVLWAKNKQKQKALISITVSILNLLITVILVQRIGIAGAAIGTAFAFLFGYTIGEGLYVHKKLGVNLVNIYKGIYKGALQGIIYICILSWFIANYGGLSWLSLTIQTVLISVIYVGIMWLIAFNDNEKRMLRSIIGK